MNVQRLKDYKARLIVFPRRNNKVKNGDATKEEIAQSTLDTSSVNVLPKAADAVTFAPITEVHHLLTKNVYTTAASSRSTSSRQTTRGLNIQELKNFKAYSALRAARADARLVGVRAKKSKEGKDEAAPAAADKE